jgi:hypothetical protein
MLDDETRPANGAQQPQEPNAETSPQGLVRQQQGGEDKQRSAYEKQYSDDTPKPILPLRLLMKFRTWKDDPFRHRPNIAEWLTVFFTGAVIVVGVLQYGVYRQQKRIMESSGGQTDQLIRAAKINACAARQIAAASQKNAKAAESFSATAGLINGSIEGAVGKLQDQVEKMDKARTDANQAAQNALQASIDIASEDRRPWVGLKDFVCKECSTQPDTTPPTKIPIGRPVIMEILNIGGISGIIENTGKTPAIQTKIDGLFATRNGADPIPDYDSVAGEQKSPEIPPNLPPSMAAEWAKNLELVKRYRTDLAPIALPPDSLRTKTIVGQAHITRDSTARIEEKTIVYAIGKITYYGTDRKTEHITTFCLFNELGSNFRFCPTGNDMK